MSYNKNFRSLLGSYFLSKWGFEVYKRGWLKSQSFVCPFCGREGKLGINPSTDFFHCFRCDEKGQLMDLLLSLERVDTFNEGLQILEKYKDRGFQLQREERVELKELAPMILPEGFRLLNQGKSQIAKSARAYIKGRGFDINHLSKMGWGYATDKEHFGYIIIPYYKDHQIIYYNARNYMSSGPRYLNPNIGESSLGKSQILYNEEALYMYKSIYLCEGVFNAIAISKDRSICTAGKYISQYQINKIIKSPVERVIIALDGDALDKSIQLGLTLIPYKQVKIINFPLDKDSNDLLKEHTLSRYIYGSRYLSYQQLIQMKNHLKL